MFTLREEQLDWEIVKHWCPGEGKDYDFSYDVMLKRRDYSTQGGVVVEYTGQPYDVWINYVVKGRELLIYSRRWKAKHNELGFKKIFSLDDLWIGTEQVLAQRPPPFWAFWILHHHSVIVGEGFFFADSEPWLLSPRKSAFVLQYPEKWDDGFGGAVGFSNALKRRIGNNEVHRCYQHFS
jgi:hypothetical protein